jgi:hypothetical protein
MNGVYLDTNVYIDWADGARLDFLRRLRRSRVPVYLSPSTLFEALEDYWEQGSAAGITRRRRVLKLIRAHGAQRILPSQGTSIMRLAGLSYSTPLNVRPGALRKYLDFALALPMIHHRRAHDGRVRFDRDTLLSDISAARDRYAALLENMKADLVAEHGAPGAAHLPPHLVEKLRMVLSMPGWRETWVRSTLRSFRYMGPVDDLVERVAAGLGAAHAFDTAILDLALCTNYSVRKNRGDWVDSNQLAHLLHPGLTFVTSDTRIRKHVATSPHRVRVSTPEAWRPGN